MRKKTPVAERLWKLVEKTDGCWLWRGKIAHNGYGRIQDDSGKQVDVHRVAYRLARGVIPPGQVIDHTCRNRACVRPDHMRAVTIGVNVLQNSDSLAAQNASKTHCPRGHLYDTVHKSGGGRYARTCKKCRAEQKRAQRAAKAAPPDC